MAPRLSHILISALFSGFLLAGCSKSDDQRQFEREALARPEGITEMTAEGKAVSGGNTDPDDWRIGPMYKGLIKVQTPAYPNPVNYNQVFNIELDLGFSDTISGLELFAFKDPQNPIFLYNQTREELASLEVLNISPSGFASSTGVGSSPYYRILIYDSNQNLITYGDVEIQ